MIDGCGASDIFYGLAAKLFGLAATKVFYGHPVYSAVDYRLISCSFWAPGLVGPLPFYNVAYPSLPSFENLSANKYVMVEPT